MGEIVFVGLGLHDEKGLSLRGLEELQKADSVFLELYTNVMPGFSLEKLEALCRRKLTVLSRTNIEDDSGAQVLDASQSGNVVLLVPGDPLIATTHMALRIDAAKKGIRTRIIHGASVISAVIGLSGLHSYKFGKSVTIPFPDENPSSTPYEVIEQNTLRGLHTLCLLDINIENNRFLSIQEALNSVLKTEEKARRDVVTSETITVGVGQAGSYDPAVKAGFVRELLTHDFGEAPHSLVFVGTLHFMEAEALIVLAGASEKIRSLVK